MNNMKTSKTAVFELPIPKHGNIDVGALGLQLLNNNSCAL